MYYQSKGLPVQYSWTSQSDACTLDDRQRTRHQVLQIPWELLRGIIHVILWSDQINPFIAQTTPVGISTHMCLLTQCRNDSFQHMCPLGCSSCRRDTGRVPGPSILSPNTAGHTHGPVQLHTPQHEKKISKLMKMMYVGFIFLISGMGLVRVYRIVCSASF